MGHTNICILHTNTYGNGGTKCTEEKKEKGDMFFVFKFYLRVILKYLTMQECILTK